MNKISIIVESVLGAAVIALFVLFFTVNPCNEIAGRDSFVASWTELTQKKVFTAYMSIMRKVGLLSGSPEVLNPVSRSVEDFRFYLENGESWFLEACLLHKYEITNMRSLL